MSKRRDLAETRWPPLHSERRGNFWINDNGVNLLKGVYDDPSNPVRLQDVDIAHALQRTLKAHNDLIAMLPSLLPEEQQRLNSLISENPLLTKAISPLEDGDTVQTAFNRRIPVYVAGPRGGRGPRHGPPPKKGS